ncbi:hypothetical protein BJF79_03465 [Actinomadura sp. CNU-125]|uniref:hypothetical protein n=1 Tax=Actinomadura sp. CNU-125 TaxID=1904961 RepID=UPI0009688791|nr:hypothetical protein [Actinomadura sp. CNU-125]OLT12972.1 hypothetical protein BJF79_03465 [Actinomadura sp. CNU-125]
MSQDPKNRIVTPTTDPDRFTPEEKRTFDAGQCSWDVGDSYWGQRDTMCHQPSKPGASFGNCAKHEAKLLENHWPDGSPRR